MTLRLLLAGMLLAGCGGFEKLDCYTWGIDCEPERTVNHYEDVTHVVVSPEPATIVIRESGTPIPGPTGAAGNPGTSCTVVQLDTGALILCEDGSSAEIKHGEDFRPGKGKK